MEMEKNSTLKYGIWLTGASMMFVSAWFCVRLTGTVGEMGRYLDSMDSVVCMEELLDYEKEENGQALEENDLAEPTLQVRMLEREDSAAAVSDSTQLSISGADYQVLLKIVDGSQTHDGQQPADTRTQCIGNGIGNATDKFRIALAHVDALLHEE